MWEKDSSVEQLLDSLKIKWKYVENLKINTLKVEDSKKNNARFGKALNDDDCTLYASKMKEGVRFPAIVIVEGGYILGGNNRVNGAIQAGLKIVDAYVCDSSITDLQRDAFIRQDNIRHGRNLNTEEKIAACVEQHRKYKISMRDLNDQFFGGKPETYSKITAENTAQDVRERLQSKNVDTKGICSSVLASLSPVKDNINVLKDAGRVVSDYKLPTAQVEEMVKDIREKQTEDEQIAVIVAWKKKINDQNTGKKNRPETNLRRELTRMRSFLATGNNGKCFPPIEKLTNDKKERKELKSDVNEIIDSLKDLKARI
jgi:hypothetical protein